MSNKILTVIKKANETKGKVLTVEDTFETWNEIVGGYIETFPLTDDILILLNEEGKLMGLEPNFSIHCHGGYIETIVGDVAFVSFDEEDNFASLTDEHLEFLGMVGILDKVN